MTWRRPASVAALALLLVGIACAKRLSELEPYPCATDGSCPDGRACMPDRTCAPATLDVVCRSGETDCSAAAPGGRCALGVCGQPCDGNRLTCPDGRVCTVAPGAGGEGACVKPCADPTDCPAHLACRQLDVRDGVVLSACVAPASSSALGARCDKTEDCVDQGATVLCFAGVCAPSCATSQDCGPGFVCPPGGGGCVRECTLNERACESDQSCEPIWSAGRRACIGKGAVIPACRSVEAFDRCDGVCGTALDDRACESGTFCPAGASCTDDGCACPTARACGPNGRRCTFETPCLSEPWWCEPALGNVACDDRDVGRMRVRCTCRDGRVVDSPCGSQVSCEVRCQDECDLVRQDCPDPAKSKCADLYEPGAPHGRCVALPPAPKREGEPCVRLDPKLIGVDDCDKGLFCSLVRIEAGKAPEYRCRRYCDEFLGSCGPGEVCVRARDATDVDANSALCRTRCTFPDGPECGPGARCTSLGGCVALATAGRAVEALCTVENHCSPPLVCDVSRNRCVPTCGPGRDCPGGYRCPTLSTAPDAGDGSRPCVKDGL